MNLAVICRVRVGFKGLHHLSGFSYFGVRPVQVDSHLKVGDNDDEHHEDEAGAPSATTGDLSLPVEGKASRVLEGVKPVEAWLFG